MHGLQVMTGFTLRLTGRRWKSPVASITATPRRAFLVVGQPGSERGGRASERLPPDVTAVFDHGKRAVSAFPMPPALTTKWTTPPEWTFLAIKCARSNLIYG